MKLKGLAPNLSNPASLSGALQNLLGVNPAQGSQSGTQQSKQPAPIQQLLGTLGKKKKPDQQAR